MKQKVRKTVFSRLGISLTVLGLLGSICAASALAASPAWRVRGAEFTGTESVAIVQQTAFNFRLGEEEISCKNLTSTGSIQETNRGVSPGLQFAGCEVPGVSQCAVRSSEQEKGSGRISTVPLTAELKKMASGRIIEIFRPQAGGLFAKVLVEGAECAFLPGTLEITGAFAAALGPEAISESLAFSEAISNEAGVEAKVKAKRLTLTGSVSQTLTGKNAGKTVGAA
jgi:hypothetical protein